MGFITRILKNIHWAIFNHPPTGITECLKDRSCDYCGNKDGWWHNQDTGKTVCYSCIHKALAKVLNV